MTTIRILASLAILAILGGIGQTQEQKIVMTHVKYDGLKQEILKHRGKVVIVDFWASNCLPCRKAFPFFIDLHKKHADKGLVIVSVSIDPVEDDREAINAANRFLNEKSSPFRNLLLDEPPELLKKQFDYVAIPFYYVFDRQGKWVRFRAVDYPPKDGVPYNKLEEIVVQMLKDK